MSLYFPAGILLLLGIGFLLRWHLKGPGAQFERLSAFFLLQEKQSLLKQGGRILHARHLFLARVGTLLCLVGLVSGISFETSTGTIVLTDGPAPMDSEWAEPLTIIRAGFPPTVASDLKTVRPVDARPNWSAAAALGRRRSPQAKVVRVSAHQRDQRAPLHGSARLHEEAVVISVVSGESVPPRVTVGGRAITMTNRGGEWHYRGPAQSGIAVVQRSTGRGFPFCIPDTGPLRVAEDGWPDTVRQVLSILPHIRFVPAADAEWRVGQATKTDGLWHPFIEFKTTFSFEAQPTHGMAAVWFASDLPVPDAALRRWRPIRNPGVPILLADDLVAADVHDGPEGRVRRFGFAPGDTDLHESAAWPALFYDAMNDDRARRSRCRTAIAGSTVILAAEQSVTMNGPSGQTRVLKPVDGQVIVDGLDEQGPYVLEYQGQKAFIAVQPYMMAPKAAVMPSGGIPQEIDLTPWLILTLCALAWVLLVMPKRGRLRMALAGCLILGILLYDWGSVRPAPIVLAVDVSASMPARETRQLVARLEEKLGDRVIARVEGAGQVTGIREPGTPLTGFSGETRHAPLLHTAAQLGGEGRVLALVTDGQAQDSPVSVSVPVFTIPVVSTRPDARIVSGRALKLGSRVFIRVKVISDLDVTGTLKIDRQSLPVTLKAGREQTVQAVQSADTQQVLTAELVVEEDRVPTNNRWQIAVAEPNTARGVGVGGGTQWLESAGFEVTSMRADALLERGAELVNARVLAIVDQPVSAIPTAVMANLKRWVHAGGLLFLAGREKAFSTGGWSGSLLDELSPLRATPSRPSGRRVGVAVLMDRSGSRSGEAGGGGLGASARLASALSAALEPDDVLTILAFAGNVQTLLPPTSIKNLGGQIRVPTAARGGTRLKPVMARARALLSAASVDERVVIVITDGRFADGESLSSPDIEQLSDGLRVIGLLVGDDVSYEPLQTLADRSAGQTTKVDGDVPMIAVQRLFNGTHMGATAGGGIPRAEPGWLTRIGGVPGPIKGRVRTQLRPGARGLATVDGDPLLAEWRMGRGRVISMATDRWPLTDEQWTGLFTSALMPVTAGPRLTVSDGRLFVESDIMDPPAIGVVRFRTIDGDEEEAQLRPWGPGLSWAPLPKGGLGILDVSTMTSAGAVTGRITRSYPAELARTKVDLPSIQLQALVTNGSTLTQGDDLSTLLAARHRRRDPRVPISVGIFVFLILLVDTYLWTRIGQNRNEGQEEHLMNEGTA